MDSQERAERIRRIPDMFRARIDEKYIGFIDEEISAGEWALGLDYVVGSLADSQSPVTPVEFDELSALQGSMEHAENLTRLNVIAQRTG